MLSHVSLTVFLVAVPVRVCNIRFVPLWGIVGLLKPLPCTRLPLLLADSCMSASIVDAEVGGDLTAIVKEI